MAGINKVILVGNLGNDPDVRTMPNGDTVAKISVATSESWVDKTQTSAKLKQSGTLLCSIAVRQKWRANTCAKALKSMLRGV